MQAVEEAFIIAVPPPPVAGVGSAGGFKLQLRDLNSAEMDRVLQAAYAIMGQAAQTPGVTGVFTTFSHSRLEDRRVGNEWFRTCRYRWSPDNYKNQRITKNK